MMIENCTCNCLKVNQDNLRFHKDLTGEDISRYFIFTFPSCFVPHRTKRISNAKISKWKFIEWTLFISFPRKLIVNITNCQKLSVKLPTNWSFNHTICAREREGEGKWEKRARETLNSHIIETQQPTSELKIIVPHSQLMYRAHKRKSSSTHTRTHESTTLWHCAAVCKYSKETNIWWAIQVRAKRMYCSNTK